MLTTMAIFLVLAAFADILSGLFIGRFLERLSAKLFAAVEEQRQTFRQVRQVRAELKSVEVRREAAKHKCDEFREKLSHLQVRLNALAERAEKRKGVKVRGHRSD